MPRPGTRAPELALPVASLAAIRHALAHEVGGDAAAQALRSAGYAAGDALAPLLVAEEQESTDIGHAAFFRRLSHLFATRGWGRLAQEELHQGVGLLESDDWVEADPAFAARRPSCFFTTGLLANLLGRAAGAPVAVLEAECRSRGDTRCRFLFGAPETLETAYASAGAAATAENLVAALD